MRWCCEVADRCVRMASQLRVQVLKKSQSSQQCEKVVKELAHVCTKPRDEARTHSSVPRCAVPPCGHMMLAGCRSHRLNTQLSRKRASTEGFDLRGEPAVATIAMPLQRPRRLLVAFVAATFLLLGKLVTVTLAMCQACLLRPQAARVASGGQAQSRPEPCTLGSLVPEP